MTSVAIDTRPPALLNVEVDDFTDPWAARRPAILLQHGYGRSAAFWTRWVPMLARHFTVIRPDLRGLGGSTRGVDPADITVEAYVDDLVAILDRLGLESVHYCGESLGGTVGLALAATHPARVRSLSLIASPVFINEGAKRAYAVGCPSWPEALRTLGVARWLEETNRSTRFPPSMGKPFLDWYVREVGRAGVEVLARMAELACAVDATPLLPRIECPVLLMGPASGTIINGEQRETYARHLRRLDVVTLETDYHMVHLIHPEACAGHVRYFAARTDGMGML